MPRIVRDSSLDSREGRRRLKARGRPYFRMVSPKLHLGYRKLKHKPGTWWARRFIGGTGDGAYRIEPLGTADDYENANGVTVFDFGQAVAAAQKLGAPVPAGPLTVAAACTRYLEYLAAEGKNTGDTSKRIAAYVLPELGNQLVSNLTRETLGKWRDKMVKSPPRARSKKGGKQNHLPMKGGEESVRRRRSSANRVFTILRAALNLAFRDGKVEVTPWRAVQQFKNVDAARLRYLSNEEAERLINTSGPELRPLVQAALETGCRYGELCRLEVRDFNPDSGTVTIRRSKADKTRHVQLTPEGAAVFQELSAGRPGNELLLRRDSGEAWGASHQRRFFIEACERAKIRPAISVHTLRHTWASLAVMAGVPLLVIARNLGHSDSRMVERHYGHLAPSFVVDAIRAGAPRFAVPKSSIIGIR